MLIVCAAGNSARHSNNYSGRIQFPASEHNNYNNIICVGASDRYDHVADDTLVKGCDIIIDDVLISDGVKLTVRPRNSLVIVNEFYIDTETDASMEVR